MSNPTPLPSVLRRLLALVGLVLVATCSDGTSGGQGIVAGYVTYDGGPVVGASVTAHQFFGGGETILAGTGTTDAEGHFEIEVGQIFQQITVTAKGGTAHLVDGTTLTLDPAAELRAPILDHPLKGRSDIVVSPFTDLAYRLGLARNRAHQDADDVASLRAAVAHVDTHLGFDVVTVTPAPVAAAAVFDEHGKYAVALAGYDQLAAIAAHDLGVSSAAVNVRLLHDQVVKDASSAEARLDGNGAEVLSVGPACPLPAGCSAEGPACYASCSVYVNSLRSRLAAASLAWLATPANHTGLGPSDILTWATALAADTDPELFIGDTEPVDQLGPSITWTTPAAGQVFTAGTIAIDVTAADPLGVATLTVDHVVGQTHTPVVDTDPAPEHFVGAIPLTPALAEGTLTLEARATDRNTTANADTRTVEINQLAGGALSGTAVKAALVSAPVTVRAFADLTTTIATGMTDASGNFINIALPEGTHGDLLVEVGGAGSYAEDVQAATVVSLAATEKLAVVVPGYVDGGTISGLVVSPATTLAAAYLTYLQGANQGGATLAAQWATAIDAIERHLGVTGITSVVPSVPSQIDSLDDPDRYGLILLALSRTAWAASSLGGGDAGAFGSAVNAMKVLQVWVRDIGDGCWDGKAGPTALSYGGPTLLTDEATRLLLAQALVAYLGSPQNQTQFHVAADVLPLLDTIASGGGNTAPGACAGTNHLFDDPGAPFDREPPVITWGGFPTTDPYVRGSVTVTATATDNLPTLPSLTFTTGQTDIDVAVNGVRAVIDATGMNGPVPLAVHAVDGSNNGSDATHDLIADNLNPAVTITAPAMDGLFLRPPVTLGWNVVELNPMATTATLDGDTAVTPGFQVATEGAHTLAVSATDRAGGMGSATRTFTIDSTAPVLTVTAPADGSYVRGPVMISFSITDANPGATASATLDGAAFTSGGSVNVEGAHTLVVTGADAAGNPAASVTRSFTIDNTPPVLTVTAPASGSFVRGPVTITFSATDNFPPATVTATLDGVGFISGGQINTEGAHTLVVNAVDRAGNPAPTVTRAFTIDNTAPVLNAVSAPAGTIVKPPLTITATATDNLMAAGSLGSDITVTSTPAPSTTTPGTSGGGNKTLVVTYATIPDGPFTARFDVTDRAGNPAPQLAVAKTIDGTPPILTWSLPTSGAGQLVQRGSIYWAQSATVTLTGTVADANLDAVTVTVANGSGTASASTTSFPGGTWSLAVPAGYLTAGADSTVTVSAVDLAGNPATPIARTLRADTTAPVATPTTTTVHDESGDLVTYAAALTSTLLPRFDVTHQHSGATVTLGGSTACDGTSPQVVKYAYLLDQAPAPYVTEPATNPLTFGLAVTDDGLATDASAVQYRVRNVATGATLRDWTPVPGVGAPYTIPIFRAGAGGIAALATLTGTKDATTTAGGMLLLAIDMQAADPFGRTSPVQTRCWRHVALPVPLAVGPFTNDGTHQTMSACSGTACDATNGPLGSGKYALKALSLADTTSPYDPIGAQVLSDGAPGTGLMEFTVYNPTTETAYLTVDFTKPTATYGKRYVATRWSKQVTSSTAFSCGFGAIDTSNPNCVDLTLVGRQPGDNPAEIVEPATGVAPTTPEFGVRVWEDNYDGTMTELAGCAGCNQTAPTGAVRLTVSLPPRGNGVDVPARKFIVVPVVKTIVALRPSAGPAFTEFASAGPGSTVVTGQLFSTQSGCTRMSWDSFTDEYTCLQVGTLRRYSALSAIGGGTPPSAQFGTSRPTATVGVSLDGTRPGPLPQTPDSSRPATSAFTWTSSEGPLPTTP